MDLTEHAIQQQKNVHLSKMHMEYSSETIMLGHKTEINKLKKP
jgi:hypothetical protein